jgi:putative DNA primase/helicase
MLPIKDCRDFADNCLQTHSPEMTVELCHAKFPQLQKQVAKEIVAEVAKSSVRNSETTADAMTTTLTPALASALSPTSGSVRLEQPDINGEFSSPLSGALYCASRNIPQIPLRPRSKVAILNGWQNLATCDADQIRKWAEEHPCCNFASVAQRNGVMIFETDSSGPRERFCPNKFTSMFSVQSSTSERGHRYYKNNGMPGIAQADSLNGDFSLRANNAYCVSPGSFHPDGPQYRLVTSGCIVDATEDEVNFWESERKSDRKLPKSNDSGDPGFRKLFDAVGWKPLADRLSKHSDSRFHNFLLEPGKLMYCPLHYEAKDKDVVFESTPFGVLKSNDALVHCFGCEFTGDMVTACNMLDNNSSIGLVASLSMYETARTVCRENGLRFEDYFPDAKTKVEATAQTGRTIKFVRGDYVIPARLKWLWRGRILADKLNVFSGEPDVGKGMTTVDFAARITKHVDFPDCKNELDGPKDVLLLSSEDDMEDTIVPRLIAAGADMTRIHFVQISENTSGTKEEGIVCLDRDLPILEAEIRLNPDIVLIIPDPVIAFLGDADPNKDKEVRPIYSKMKTFAKRLNVAWLFVNHWNKNQNATSINKTSGAKTMVSAPRATWMFSRSPEDPTRYLMMKGKGNLSTGRTKTLAYRIISVPFDFGDGRPADPDGVPKLVWDGETDHTCDEVLQDATEPKNRRSSKAEELLTKLLAGGAKLAREIYIAGDKEGLSADKMKRARYQLGYFTREVGNEWYWAKSEADIMALKLRVYAPAESVTLGK